MRVEQDYKDCNFLIITLDSCRWDVFTSANTPNMEKIAIFRKAYAQGTYTYPAHMSMYQGIFPNVYENIPLYNRFSKNIFRIDYRRKNIPSIVTFNADERNIVTGFRRAGYYTTCLGAIGWFTHKDLIEDFEDFTFTGIDFLRQIETFEQLMQKSSKPFFSLINIGETHEPYMFGGLIEPILDSRARMRKFKNVGYKHDDFAKQVSCLEFIDQNIEKIFTTLYNLDRPTLIIICADHGECFGEDGLYGHGFYHLKVMEVPLGIAKLNARV